MTDDAEVLQWFRDVPIDYDTIAFYRGLLAGEVVANRCQDCGHWHSPPRPICPQCWSSAVVATPLRGTGTVYMFTRIHHHVWRGSTLPLPFTLVTVEMDEQAGLRLSGPLLDAHQIEVGEPVLACLYDGATAPDLGFRRRDEATS